MGVTRKMVSMFSLGAVDFRSDKERIAMYTKQTRNAARKAAAAPAAVHVAEQNVEDQQRTPLLGPGSWAPVIHAVKGRKNGPASPPPGWYDDAADPTRQRWWDGSAWSEHTQAKT